MATYKNNTEQTIMFSNRMGYNQRTVVPGETIIVPFYINPSVGLSFVNDTGNIDTVLHDETKLLDGTEYLIEVSYPKISPFYKVKITNDNKSFDIKYNVTTNNALNVVGNEIFERIILWEYAPKFYLTSAAGASVRITIEEVHSVCGC